MCGTLPATLALAHIHLSPLYHLSVLDIVQRYQAESQKLCGPGNEATPGYIIMWSMHPDTARETAEIVTMST